MKDVSKHNYKVTHITDNQVISIPSIGFRVISGWSDDEHRSGYWGVETINGEEVVCYKLKLVAMLSVTSFDIVQENVLPNLVQCFCSGHSSDRYWWFDIDEEK